MRGHASSQEGCDVCVSGLLVSTFRSPPAAAPQAPFFFLVLWSFLHESRRGGVRKREEWMYCRIFCGGCMCVYVYLTIDAIGYPDMLFFI